MAGPNDQNQNQESTFFAFLIVLIILYVLFYIYKENLIEVWRSIRLAELYVWRALDSWPFFNALNIEYGYQWLANTPASQITGEKMQAFDEHYGVFRYVLVPLPLFLGYRLLCQYNNRNRSYDMESLLVRISTWKHMEFLSEFINRRPEKGSIFYRRNSRNRDAASLTPTEFAEMVPPPGLKVKRPIYEGEFFDKDLARKALDLQLGRRWTGSPQSLKPYELKLFKELMSIIIVSGYKVPMQVKDESKRVAMQRSAIMKELNQHAFVRTMFISMFELSKGGGVVAALRFRWMKSYDRTLWYCLSSLGRKTPFVESAGCHAHWELEKKVGMPIPYIETQCAVDGLEFTIFGPKDEEEDPTYS